MSDHVSAPTLGKKQVITTTEAATNWLLYTKPPSEGPVARLVARPTALSGNAQILRLGAQLFRKNEDNEYHAASGRDAPTYFEEVSGRGALVVIGSRSHTLAAQLQEPYRPFERLGEDFTRLERLENLKDTEDDSISDESDDEWLSEASSDSSDIKMEAYESWSEGSTDVEGYVSSDSSSESDVSEQSTPDTGSEAEPEEDSTCNSSGDESDLVGAKSTSGTDTPSVRSLSAFPNLGYQDSDAEEELWALEVDDALHKRPLGQTYDDMRSSNAREPTVLLTTLQYDENPTPIKLFEYSCPLRFMLYDSPPAVHPQESLVVWPLGGGDLLFADVFAKTYFTRRLRLSASHSE